MAMNGNTLATEIIAAMASLSEEDKRNQTEAMKKLANAIIDHIKSNASVVAGITCSVDPGTHIGATTGTGTIV